MKIPPQYVAMLVKKAVEDSDPALYADLILDNVPEEMIRSVLAAGIVPTLAAVDARVKDHAEWFESLGATLGEAMTDHAPESGGPSAPDGTTS